MATSTDCVGDLANILHFLFELLLLKAQLSRCMLHDSKISVKERVMHPPTRDGVDVAYSSYSEEENIGAMFVGLFL